MCQCINKVVLIVVNVLFAIIGAGMVGLSLWVIFSQDTFFSIVKVVTQDVQNVDDATLTNYVNSVSMLTAAAWVLVGFGALSLLIGLCGCIGAAKESPCLLMIYAVLVSIILIAEIACAVVAIVFKTQIEAELAPRLTTIVERHFLPWNLAINGSKDNINVILSGYINYMHISLQCCGISNVNDTTADNTLWSRSNGTYNGNSLVVPVTCCSMKDSRSDLLAKQDWNNVGNYLTDPTCPTTGNTMLTTGCYQQINNLISRYTWPIIIGSIVVGLLEILFVVMACSLVQSIRSGGDGQSV